MKKYKMGDVIVSFDDLIKQKKVFWKGDKIGRAIFLAWPLSFARNQIADGVLNFAEEI